MSLPDYSVHVGDSNPQPPHPHTSAAPNAQSPLTGYDPDFLNQRLPPFLPASPSREDSPYPVAGLHFDEAYHPSPSPPLANFLDNILNPAGLDHNRYSPFPPPTWVISNTMPPTTRAHPQSAQRPARLPNGYVDLTATPDSPPQRRKREATTPGPSAKRQKRDKASESNKETAEPPKVEEVDLTDDKEPVQEILQKQREDAVKSQTKPEEAPTTFNNITCVICMDSPTDLTATTCGHLFCHTCLMEALIAGENRAGPGEPKRSQCPVCRKNINRFKSSDTITLSLMKGIATQPRKKVVSTPASAASKV
ncbi:hypothetical protein BKA66DRAFT_474274 [Pyrenochaeta sp. MPI-SDFR-AT-0127]|nr:hypothetical protein BKA66DRAFT_474274 [Pyrenochaeta sp. MPI-SDFR-AT-0127]